MLMSQLLQCHDVELFYEMEYYCTHLTQYREVHGFYFDQFFVMFKL